jgi:hypothetical protein
MYHMMRADHVLREVITCEQIVFCGISPVRRSCFGTLSPVGRSCCERMLLYHTLTDHVAIWYHLTRQIR